MFSSFVNRSAELELMDGLGYSSDEFIDNLADLRRVNRYLGGQRALFTHLLPLIEQIRHRPVRLLDIGTGSADLPVAIVKWARRHDIELEFVVIDINEIAARQAHEISFDFPEITAIQADAMQPPFPARSFDFVVASLFLHHFETPQAAQLIANFARVARVAVLINDLRRHPIAYYTIKMLTWLFTTNRMMRHDAALSVMRGFTGRDVDEISRLAGTSLHIFRHFPYRLLAIGYPPPLST